MRNNVPVTQREYPIADDTTLMSVTDVNGRIVYANAAFIKTSGFDKSELIGAPHNVVRHPDMPAEAFADMWATLRAGISWSAVVKNRRKNGDHYWVRANATPIVRDGVPVGYLSVRTRPGRDEIDAAAQLYRRFVDGRATGLRFHHGLVVRGGLLGWTAVFRTMPVRTRIRYALAAVAACCIAAAYAAGLRGAPLGAFAAAAALLGGATASVLERQIARPLEQMLTAALGVAAGERGGELRLGRVDEIGMLARAIQQSGLNLHSLVDDVSEQIGGLQTTNDEMVRDNVDLSRRSEEAASSLEQTAASMQQMTSIVDRNAQAANRAGALAGSSSDAAAQGRACVERVVGMMSGITEASRRINEIIGVIDSIAFQTNILALNAAVEAARAGSTGRGFAVVAGEVRTLAQKSATAASEIRRLIGDSVCRIDDGSEVVGAAGHAMNSIVSEVERVGALIAEIGSATKEQADGIGQINTAVGQLDQMTQKNAALVGQSAATAESLRERTAHLLHAVAVFGRHDTLRSAVQPSSTPRSPT
ncbi:methyl-accepting chemotaxis protein [Paraburkholderia caballeronis]|uniref:Methyl-accepting chemotaxis sensory transducer with Pas/Pac sensor n=1 Tax=Paraburkholderia caballeronis TaxID=416943 RepID=A0A1H7RKV7_9BURK|nr:PAS domain-containing methyl-accepting chemotaxis protein [Paraburkholderia caballeronis]PXW23090.1 methyl-accepting chemotaxis sensory transducer with Pas/Pac sensor [Paraburkholderia caballeronis]PXW97754.1 methyl-accepting chemotaxis sensory transducer with Pas/Pac sensor [Paraburkholderia caballeronis]RAJ94724.1 methyl-accepting chemotaxis sensory transducer with Pas/Pac sensor [Paraburkholderia caballeronis]SEE60264.1 methyl-accepting chemotaxis sensory transducer with Pas/Pac sensor [P